jgi:DNA-binding MarR family transcriptional regulator
MDRSVAVQVGIEYVKDGFEKLSCTMGDALRALRKFEDIQHLKEQYVAAQTLIELGLKRLENTALDIECESRSGNGQAPLQKILKSDISAVKQHAFMRELITSGEFGIRQKDVQGMIDVNPSVISRFLIKLQQFGLIERRSEKSGRQRPNLRIFATRAGRERFAELTQAVYPQESPAELAESAV